MAIIILILAVLYLPFLFKDSLFFLSVRIGLTGMITIIAVVLYIFHEFTTLLNPILYGINFLGNSFLLIRTLKTNFYVTKTN